MRSYTPISGDHQPGHFDVLIKSYPTGNISRHMASLAVGQTVRVKGPKGAFVYTPNMVRHFGMIAGGTGITPMLQVVKAIVRGRAAGDRTEVDLIFANVTEQDILLREDLDQLAREDKGFRVHYVLDKPPAGWEGGQGYVTSDMIQVCSSLFIYQECGCYVGLLTGPVNAEMASQARSRRQDPAVRPAAHGGRSQEDDRGPRVREGPARQQAGRPGLCLLSLWTNGETFQSRNGTQRPGRTAPCSSMPCLLAT